jgi:DNA-binding beta-propeller fold protein YncE
MLRKFKIIGMAIFLIVFSGCGGGNSSSGGGSGTTKNVTTVAGSAGSTGSANGIGAAARFFFPVGITTDGTNLYVTDFNNSTIRKIVIATGEVSTIAGTPGTAGSADGTGATARFNKPYGITTDGTNLYVADSNNNTIRKIVIATQEVTTIAGTPGTTGFADGTGGAASFISPEGIILNGGNLYLTDSNNHTIRQIVLATGAVTTIAGTPGASGWLDATGPAALFNVPQGITTDGPNLYVTDSNNFVIRQIALSTGAVTTIAGRPGSFGFTDGFGFAANFNHPIGITTDGTNLYVTDTTNSEIRRIVISTAAVTTVAGAPLVRGSADGSVGVATFDQPFGITRVGRDLYVADTNNNTIRKIH